LPNDDVRKSVRMWAEVDRDAPRSQEFANDRSDAILKSLGLTVLLARPASIRQSLAEFAKELLEIELVQIAHSQHLSSTAAGGKYRIEPQTDSAGMLQRVLPDA